MLIALVPLLFQEGEEARELLQQKQDKIFSPDYPKAAWCHLYEQPAPQHFASGMIAFGMLDELKSLAESPNQIQAMASIVQAIQDNEYEPSEEEAAALRPHLAHFLAYAESTLRSLRCLLTFGLYMNELIALVRSDDPMADKALLSAVKIDPTVLGCPSVIPRISRAVMLDDGKFLGKVRRAMAGNFTKREQKTYQDMRLVLQVLHESGAPKLTADDLYSLFHGQLNLVRNEAGEGDVKNSLRQFTYQFMKQKAVSQNP
ncbi:hypothetical protein [Sulfuritalea sp.]|uniref:hypothetical protein n=1 Tax=Sulfuritalea sp. TaxID=2480090 RepID=UPI00286E9E17|nr:hypothetical protein [Sulfuritalea sp.]